MHHSGAVFLCDSVILSIGPSLYVSILKVNAFGIWKSMQYKNSNIVPLLLYKNPVIFGTSTVIFGTSPVIFGSNSRYFWTKIPLLLYKNPVTFGPKSRFFWPPPYIFHSFQIFPSKINL